MTAQEFLKMAQESLDKHFTGIRVAVDSTNGRLIIENRDEFIRQCKLKYPEK